MAETLVDDLSPLYRQTRDAMDGDRWQQTLAVGRRPHQVQSPADVKALVADIAPRYGVDPRLVESVIGLESGGQPGAVSRKGAQGLMQLMPGTARRFGVVDPLDPVQNITGGVKYLAWLRDQFPGRTDLQLAGYHAGEGAVRNAGYAVPNTHDGNMSTQQYVTTILARYKPTLPGEDGRPGLDVRGDLARQALREGQAGPTLQVNPDVNQLSAQARAGKPIPSLPGEGGMPPLDVSRETQQRPMALPGTPLRVETDLGNLMARTEGQPTALPAGSQPFDPNFPKLEAGLEEQAGRLLGGALSQGIGGMNSLVQAVVAAENLAGLKRPDVPGMTDPMGAEFLTPIIKAAEQATKPAYGEAGPLFIDKLAGAAGTSLASLLPGAAALRFLRGVGAVAPTLASLGGALTSGMIEAAQEAGGVFEQMAPIVGEDEASKRALKSFVANTVLVTVTDKFGIFGEEARLLRRALAGAIANGVQEAVQYDIERRQLWVPATNPAAEALQAAGWVQDGDRLVKPFNVTDAAEAALIGMVMGGPAAAAVSTVAEKNVPAWADIHQQEAEAAGGAVDEHFGFASVLEAAQQPDTPPPGVEPSTWQRWGSYFTSLFPDIQPGMISGILRSQRGSISGAPTLRLGAEGLTPERYRTPSGGWRVPLKDIPSAELELKDFVVQQGGIQLAGEELRGELEAVISRKETGLSGLQNNSSGLTLQQMAESAEQQGFIPTADKEALLQALDRSVVQGHPVWSLNATGRINLLDDPFVSAAYQAVVDAVDVMKERTTEQVAGVRHRREVHAEAAAQIEMGMFSHDDIREILPNTTLNDTQASALVQSLNTIGEELGEAAQRFLDGGARVGSREEASLQEIMALLAELDPVRLGVSAAQARGLGILNDPLSGYTQYLNNLHRALETAPEKTMAQIAKNILAAKPQKALSKEELAAHPELLEDLFQRHYAMVERFKANPLQFQLESEDAGTLLAQRTPEERALIEAAYTPGGEPRTVEEWNALSQAARTEREREAIARAREQWQQGILDYQAFQEELKEGYQGRQLDLPDSQGATFHAATQMNLFDEFKEVQEALTALREDRATDAQKELLDQVLRPWKVARQGDLSFMGRLGISTEPVLEGVTRAGKPLVVEPTMAPTIATLPVMKGLMDSTKPGFAPYFKELMYNAWLSNPSTHLANFISNLGVTVWAIPERWIASNYQAGTEGIPRGEANAMLYGLVHGLHDAWVLAYRSWQAGKPLSGLGREWTKDPAGNAQDMGFDPASPWGKMIDFFFNYIGLASGGRLPSRALMASDEFFKMLNYRAELNALAYRDAVRHGYEGRAFAEHVTRVISTPQLAQLQEAANTFSVIQTFQNELQPGGLGERIQGLADYAPKIFGTDQTFPVGRVILPFVQTPSNIGRYFLERTPLGIFFSTFQADMRAGGERAALAHAKVATGTIAMTVLAGLALAGKITGRGPEDRELRDIWRQSYQPYSVKLPTGQWVSLDRFEPLGSMVKMVADLVQIAGEAHTDTWQMATLAPVMVFLKNTTSASYFQALSSFFDVMAPDLGAKEQAWESKIWRWSNRTLAGLLIPSSALAATARFLDPVERDAQSLVDALYSRIPGWKDDLPARRTLGGEKLLFGYGFQPEVIANTIRAYSPMKLGTGRISLVDNEILRNKMQLDLPARTIAHDAVPVGQLAGETQMDTGQLKPLPLTPAQYEKLVVLASGNQQEAQKLGVDLPGELLGMLVDGLSQEYNAVPPANVKSLYDFLDWAAQQPHYQAASPGAGGGKEALFKRAINAYRGVGKQLLLAQDDALRTRRDESLIQATVQSLPLNIQRETAQQMRTQYGAAATQTKEQLGLHVGGARP